MLSNLKLFILFFVSLQTQIKAQNQISTECFISFLKDLGCSCRLVFETVHYPRICSKGLIDLNCIFPEKIDYTKNYINDVTSLFKYDGDYCFNNLYFQNVYQISINSLTDILLRPNTYNEVQISFEHFIKIDSVAFGKILIDESANLILKLNYFSSDSFSQNSFSYLKNCKRIEFLNSNNLKLHSNLFFFSKIDTILIQNSYYNGFLTNPGYPIFSLKNFTIENSFLDKIELVTIPYLSTLEYVAIRSSGVKYFENLVFDFCCKSIKQLHLDGNSINFIKKDMFVGLFNLISLSLDKNPIELVEPGTFNLIGKKLIKLKFGSTKIVSIKNFYKNLSSLKELHFDNLKNFDFDNIEIIFQNSPQLEYLNLENTEVIKNMGYLNELLTRFNSIIDLNRFSNIKFLNLKMDNLNLDLDLFKESFNKLGKCLWNKLLSKTFIQVNEDHPCNCALFYLYHNLNKYDFPDDSENNPDHVTKSYYNLNSTKFSYMSRWEKVLSLMPKCYRKIWFKNFDNTEIIKLENSCGIFREEVTNCSFFQTTTSNPISGQTTEEEFVKKVPLHLSASIMGSLFAILIVLILFLAYKARYDFKNQFTKIYYNSYKKKSFKEMNTISFISPLN